MFVPISLGKDCGFRPDLAPKLVPEGGSELRQRAVAGGVPWGAKKGGSRVPIGGVPGCQSRVESAKCHFLGSRGLGQERGGSRQGFFSRAGGPKTGGPAKKGGPGSKIGSEGGFGGVPTPKKVVNPRGE